MFFAIKGKPFYFSQKTFEICYVLLQESITCYQSASPRKINESTIFRNARGNYGLALDISQIYHKYGLVTIHISSLFSQF